MAVFLINICKFNGCGITFPSLSDLISHIEDTHIDYDPKVVEQKEQAQPACLPLSYVLRFISDDARKEAPYLTTNAAGVELKRKLAIKHHSYSMSSSNRSTTPTGSEMDEDEMVVTESEDSNDSWTTEEFSSEFIMRYGSRHSGGGANGTPGNEKPFACPVPGCKKRYKNVNGIKYHSKNGHKKDGKVRKGFKCHCGKSYKTAQGLKNHAQLTHNAQPESVLTTQQLAANNAASSGGVLLQRSGSPSQSLGSLSPSSMSNMSSSASSCHGGSNGSIVAAAVNSNNSSSSSATNNNNAINGNTLQQLIDGIVTVSSNVQQQATQQQTQLNATQHQQHLQIASATSTSNPTGNNLTNNLMRSTLGLVSIKANHVNSNAVTTVATNVKTSAATNLLAANAAASKILKLATNVANGNNGSTNGIVDIVQQHKIVDNKLQQHHQQTGTITPTKITLPNLVNLGILTPATSPTKNTQTLTFATQQQQQQQHHHHHQQQQQVQQQQLQQHNLPMTPISPNSSGSSSNSSSPIPQQKATVGLSTLSPSVQSHSHQQQPHQLKKQNIIANIQLTTSIATTANGPQQQQIVPMDECSLSAAVAEALSDNNSNSCTAPTVAVNSVVLATTGVAPSEASISAGPITDET